MSFYAIKKRTAIMLATVALLSCKKNQDKTTATEEAFKMYQRSEMAALMEKMYAHHQVQKSQLIQGNTPKAFPEYFLSIHTATLTDASDNDTIFSIWADRYIQYEKALYSDKKNAKYHYNNAINACIKCHEQKCTGPIPRIRKLLISD